MSFGYAAFGLGAIQGVLGGLQAKTQAKTEAAQKRLQIENQNFQQRWQIDKQNRNALRQWEAQLRQNAEARTLATEDVALRTLYNQLAFDNQHSALSKQTAQVNDAMISNFSGRGIDPNSGSARLLMRQSLTNAVGNSAGLKLNERTATRDIETRYDNIMRSLRDPFAPDQSTFMPGADAVADNSSSAFMGALVSGLAGGASQGIGLAARGY